VQSSRQVSRAECFLVNVGDLADGELAQQLLQWLSGGVDGQVVRRSVVWNCHIISNHPVALNCQDITNRHHRSEPATSASSPIGVIWGPASSLKARTVVIVPGRSSSVCHSASSSYGRHCSCNVQLPPVDDICAVF